MHVLRLFLLAMAPTAFALPFVITKLSQVPVHNHQSPLLPASPFTPPYPACSFVPSISHSPPHPMAIPPQTWPHIHALLATHPSIRDLLTCAAPATKALQTLDIARITGDASLEGLILGLMFTPRRHGGGGEGAGVRRTGKDVKRREETCLQTAAAGVANERLREGSLEIGGGRVEFLVYRND